MDKSAVWIDGERCTGCGACVSVCPTEAIALAEGKACVDSALCNGCAVCIPACPAEAIHPVLEGEIVPAAARPPAVQPAAPLAQRQPAPLRETAAAVVVAAGTGLVLRTAQAVARALVRRLLRPRNATVTRLADRSAKPAGLAGGGRRARRRQQGRR